MDTPSDKIRELEERIVTLEAVQEIRNLVAAYSLAADALDEDTWVQQFADDGVLDMSAMGGDQAVFDGKKAIAKFFRKSIAPGATSQQQAHNVHIEVDGQRAQGAVFWTARTRLADGSFQPVAGRYIDDYVKTGDGWKIKKRVLTFSR